MLFVLDTLVGYIEVFFLQLEADEVSLRADSGNGCGATAHAVVEDSFTLVGVSLDKIFDKGYGLLGGVELFGTTFRFELLPR